MTSERQVLTLTGLACGGGGATTVERSLRRVRGVQRVHVDPYFGRAIVDADPGLAPVARLVAAVERVGYGVSSVDPVVAGTTTA